MILLTGAGGFVGSKIFKMRNDVIPSSSLRGMSEEAIKRMVDKSGADVIIHTAAISDVRACSLNPEESYFANVQLPIYLAKASKDIKLICFSSDQVYTGYAGEGPYTEDMAKPANIYAEHKLEMENRVLDILPDAVMLRAEWMYDYYLKKSNYLMNILNAKDELRFSSQTYRGITYVKEVAENIDKTIALPGGVYNFGSETVKSMYEITRDFLAAIGKNIELSDAPKNHNLWINCEKARRYGLTFSSVEDGLISCARDYNLLK